MSFKGLFDSPDPPAAPNPAAIAAAQGAANKDVARLTNRLNRVDQTTPYGNLTFTEGPEEDRWNAAQTFSPAMEARFDIEQALATGLGGQAQQRLGALDYAPLSFADLPEFTSGIDYSVLPEIPGIDDFAGASEEAADAAFERQWNRLSPQFEDEQRDLHTRLINQGIEPGDRAYQNEMDDFMRRKNEARLAASQDAISVGEAMRQGLFASGMQGRQQVLSELLSDADLSRGARQQGITERLTERNLPINEIAAILQGAPAVQTPGFVSVPGTAVAPPDVTGAYGLGQAAAQNRYNAELANQQGLWGGLTGLGSAYLLGR